MKSSVKQIVFDWVIPVVITLLGTATAAAGLYFSLYQRRFRLVV